MILACQNISKAFGTNEILKDASFHIEEREKAALVGINGAGKSTLFKIIVGEMTADTGEVILSKGKTLGYLAQHQDLTGDLTIYEEVLQAKQDLIRMEERLRALEEEMKHEQGERLEELMNTYTRLSHTFELENGYAYRSEVVGVLKGLGFEPEEFEKKVSTLSGGQKTRVALGRLLLTKPDVILLDEPTNHLDMDGKLALAEEISRFEGGLILVSHDRELIEKSCNRFWYIDGNRLTEYHDLDQVYDAIRALNADSGTGNNELPAPPEQSVPVSDEEDSLAALITLEEKLAADLQRKPAHQKPVLQQQWREQIAQLRDELGL